MKFTRDHLWSNCCFCDKFYRVTRKNTAGNTNVLTISAQHGLISQFEYYNNQYASEDTSAYTLLHKGDFAYNKSYSEGHPFGATKRLEQYDAGIVSPLYICFTARDGVCADYYAYYFESEPFYREIYKIAQEGARNHGLLNVPTEDFFKIKIADPPLEEQRRIAEILGGCDRVIALKKELIAEKKRQKKALMQKLLNPDSGFRLPGFTGEWRSLKLENCGAWLGGGTPPKQNRGFWENGTINWISSQEVKTRMIVNTTYKITEEAIRASTSNIVPKNSLIFIARSGVLQHSFPIAKITNPMAINQDIKALTPNAEVNIDFLHFLLEEHECNIIKNYVTSGTTVQSLRFDDFREMLVKIPPQDEQQAIADILSVADREIDLLEQELALQQQKKKSLMQLLLTGIVRV